MPIWTYLWQGHRWARRAKPHMWLLASAEPWLLTPPLRVLDSFQYSLLYQDRGGKPGTGSHPCLFAGYSHFFPFSIQKGAKLVGHTFLATPTMFTAQYLKVSSQFLINHELGSPSSFIEREGRSWNSLERNFWQKPWKNSRESSGIGWVFK